MRGGIEPATRHERRAGARLICALMAIVLFGSVASTPAAIGRLPRPVWAGPGGSAAHTGRSPVRAAQSARLQQIGWPYQTSDEIESSPVVARSGTVYVGSDDGHLWAINPNGLVRSRTRTSSAVTDAVALGRNGWVYAVDTKGKLYGIDPGGRVRWAQVVAKGGPAPVASGDTVYAAGGGTLAAYTLAGHRKWTSRGAQITGLAATSTRVYVGTQSGRLVVLTASGQHRWTAHLQGAVAAPTVAPSGDVFVGTLSQRLYALSAAGRIKWSRTVPGVVEGSVALRPGGGLFVPVGLPSQSGALVAYSSKGRRLWTFHAHDAVFSSPAVGADGTIYFGSFDDDVYAVTAGGHLKWRYQTGEAVTSSPAIASDGTLYIGSDDGGLYAFAGPHRAAPGAAVKPFTPAGGAPGHARLIAPGAVAAGPGGKVFVADLLRYGIVELAPSGRSLGVLGARGTGNGGFQLPSGIAVDSNGDAFATDAILGDVQEFVPTHHGGYRFAARFGAWTAGGRHRELEAPLAIAVNSARGRVYVGDARWGLVEFTTKGRFIASFSPGRQYVVHSVAVGPRGELYATFNALSGITGAQRTYRLSSNLGSPRDIGFADPAGAPYLVLDHDGHYITLSPGSPSVTKFEPGQGSFAELTFFQAAAGFHYGLGIDGRQQLLIPSFGNTPKPRGIVAVYSSSNLSDPSAAYRRTAVLRGG